MPHRHIFGVLCFWLSRPIAPLLCRIMPALRAVRWLRKKPLFRTIASPPLCRIQPAMRAVRRLRKRQAFPESIACRGRNHLTVATRRRPHNGNHLTAAAKRRPHEGTNTKRNRVPVKRPETGSDIPQVEQPNYSAATTVTLMSAKTPL